MLIKNTLFIISFLSILSIAQTRFVIPTELNLFISKNYEGFKIPSDSNFSAGWKEYIGTNEIPYFCKSDFNGDGFEDFAVLLVKGNGVDAIVFQKSQNGFSSYLIDTFSTYKNKIDAIITVEEKGVWEGIDDSVEVKNDGISIDFLEESVTKLFFWHKGKYLRFYTD